jgi:transposase IS116/IS110/IS902 family protein
MGSSRRSLDAIPVKCKVLRCRRLYLSATDPARLGPANSDCVFRCFVKGFSRIVLGIHGSDFPGSEIGCFEPGNVFWREPYAAAAYHQLLATCILLLCSIPGIAQLTAAKLLAEPAGKEFGSARQLAAYAALTASEHCSGGSFYVRTRLCKIGNAFLRKALFMPAATARRWCQPLPTLGPHSPSQTSPPTRRPRRDYAQTPAHRLRRSIQPSTLQSTSRFYPKNL